MQNDLDGRATHHCYCWSITRTDGQTFGFTDHDRDLTFNSTTFVAETGLTPSALEASIGLNTDNMDVMGILNSISIDEQDLAAGQYDNATVISYRVDWKDVANRVIILQGSVGEVSRGNLAFTAEIRGLAHELNQKTGGVYEPTCRVDLGSARCGINLAGTSPSGFNYTVSSTVTSVAAKNFFRADQAVIQALPDEWFSRGLLTWISGANIGLGIEVKVHQQEGLFNAFFLWEPMPFQIQVGDEFTVSAGCDKSQDNCHNKFANMINHRGFNLIPGNDVVLRSAVQEEDNSGGSVF